MVFFSAIDEGLVLTLAEKQDIQTHLENEMAAMTAGSKVDCVLVCDCILRKLEASQTQKTIGLSEIMRRHRMVGFNTYGEQFGTMHVNQTMTGVAIFAPKALKEAGQ